MYHILGCDSTVVIVERYRLDGPEIDPVGGNIFHTSPDQPCGPPSLL